MSIFSKLRHRATEPEIMDDFTVGGAELREALLHLQRLNRIFAAASPTLYGVRKLWKQSGSPQKFSVVDVGCGSGDVNRKLLHWAKRNDIDIHITLIDVTQEACDTASQIYDDEPRVTVKRSDVMDLPADSVDIVTGSQFLHHFTGQELVDITTQMLRVSRLGVVINDIHRHWLAWGAVWVTSRIISRNRYILHDGPLSVAKGFTAQDWRDLRHALDTPELVYHWRALFRYSVIIPGGDANYVHTS